MQIDDVQLRTLIADANTRTGLWNNILRAADCRTAAELGVWKGNFASKILQGSACLERYHMIDPWAYLPDWNRAKNVETENFEDIYQMAMAATSFAAEKRVVLRGKTKDVIHGIPDETLDFAYIDGDHTLRGVTIDLIKVLPKMKPGGLIGGDDFFPKPWPQNTRFEPTMVCPYSIYFAEAHDLPFFCLPFDQFLILNSPRSGFSFTDLTGLYGDISLARGNDEQRPGQRRKAVRQARRWAKRGGAPS